MDLQDSHCNSSELIRACYYSIVSIADERDNQKFLYPEQIDPFLCTHIIIIGFASIYKQFIVPQKKSVTDYYKRVLSLKKINPELKVVICLTGGFQELVKNNTSVDLFAFNARQFLLDNNLDGLDLDWEFPAWPIRHRKPHEKQEFTYLVTQLWNALKLSSHPPLSLSLAVCGVMTVIDRSYEIDILAKNVDFISLMGYDYRMYTRAFPFTGHNAPLFKSRKDVSFMTTLNIEWSADYWVKKGCPKHKLVVGIPTYGRTWKLLSFMWHDVRSPAVSAGIYGGYISYPEALAMIKNGAKEVFDFEHNVPYAYMGRNWISFENRRSIAEKALWIKKNKFAGIMTFSLNADDYEGTESGRKFDLHLLIKNIFMCLI